MWTPIKVSKFTRRTHPDDYQPGLPDAGELEAPDRYEVFLVRRNKAGEWVGSNGTVNLWLVMNCPIDNFLPTNTPTDAEPIQTQPPVLPAKAIKKGRRKQSDI